MEGQSETENNETNQIKETKRQGARMPNQIKAGTQSIYNGRCHGRHLILLSLLTDRVRQPRKATNKRLKQGWKCHVISELRLQLSLPMIEFDRICRLPAVHLYKYTDFGNTSCKTTAK